MCDCKGHQKYIGNQGLSKIKNDLKRIAAADGGWSNLYQCLSCNVLWEKTYPKSYEHGGGTPELTQIAQEEAKQKYSLNSL